MNEIAEFLLARIAEDEKRANDCWRVRADVGDFGFYQDVTGNMRVEIGTRTLRLTGDEFREQFMEHNPDRRVLAECAAKRKLIEAQFEYASIIDGEWGDGHSADEIRAGKCRNAHGQEVAILEVLAEVYAEHRDYRQEWARDTR